MRPVNLIPAEDRPGGQRPLRTGPLAYVIVGVLALAVIGLALMVVTNGEIADREAEVAQLQGEEQAAKAEAQELAAYTEFHDLREQRVATMTGLADSRFDWPRVLGELALVLPIDVHLSSLEASASPAAGGGGVAMRASIGGPALELVGCASSQASVGAFVEALKAIDGVTRVGVQSSAIGGETESGPASAATCGAGKAAAQFQMVVGFDAAPAQVEAEGGEAAAVPEATEAASAEAGEAGGEEGGEG